MLIRKRIEDSTKKRVLKRKANTRTEDKGQSEHHPSPANKPPQKPARKIPHWRSVRGKTDVQKREQTKSRQGTSILTDHDEATINHIINIVKKTTLSNKW